MTYEVYRIIFISAGIMAGILLFLAIVLFFGLNIPKLIGDLTGRNAQKAIQNIREKNKISVNSISKKKKHINMESNNVETITQKLSKQPDSLTSSQETVLLNMPLAVSTVSIITDITFIHTNEVID